MEWGLQEPDRSTWPFEAQSAVNALNARVEELTVVLQERAAYTDKLVEDLAELRHQLIMLDVTEVVSPHAEPTPTLRPIQPSSPAPSGPGDLELSQGSANLQDVCTMSQRSTIEAIHSKAQQESVKIVEFLQRITALQEEGSALNEHAYKARAEGETHRRQSLAFQCQAEGLTHELELLKLELRQARADKQAADVAHTRQESEAKEREHTKDRELAKTREETTQLRRQVEELQKELDYKDTVRDSQTQLAEKEAHTWQERCNAAEAAHKKLCTDMSRRVEEHAVQLTAEAARYEELRKEIEESRRRGDLTGDLHRASAEVVAATQARQVAEQKVASLEADLQSLQVQCRIMNEQTVARAEQLTAVSEAHTTELESLREQLQAAQQQASSLSEEVAGHASAAHEAREEAKAAREALAEVESRASAIGNLEAETSKKITGLEGQLTDVLQEREALARNLSQEQRSTRDQLADLERQAGEWQAQVVSLQQMLDDVNKQLESSTTQGAELSARVTDLEKQLSEAEEKAKAAQGESKEAVREAAELRGEVKGVTEALAAVRAEREAEGQRLKTELDSAANLLKTAQEMSAETTARHEAELADLRTALQNAEALRAHVANADTEHNQRVTEMQNQLGNLKSQVEHLQQSLQNAQAATQEAYSQHEDTKRQLSQLQQQSTTQPIPPTHQQTPVTTANHVQAPELVRASLSNNGQHVPLNLVQAVPTAIVARNPVPLVAATPAGVPSNGIRIQAAAVTSPTRDAGLMPAPLPRVRNNTNARIETIEVQDTQDEKGHSQGNGGEVVQAQLVSPNGKVSKKRSAEGEADGAPPQSRIVPKGRPVISLSGFKNTEPGYTLNDKQRAHKLIKDLGGEVTKDQGVEALDEKVTHVVAPATARTVKILAAALSGKWIMPVEWLWACGEGKMFTEESAYGFCGASNLVRGKKYFASSGLQKARLEQVHQLVAGYGGGTATTDMNEADFVFIKTNDERSSLGPCKAGAEVRTFDEFVHWVYKAAKEGSPNPR